jgi:hypothetical protein
VLQDLRVHPDLPDPPEFRGALLLLVPPVYLDILDRQAKPESPVPKDHKELSHNEAARVYSVFKESAA